MPIGSGPVGLSRGLFVVCEDGQPFVVSPEEGSLGLWFYLPTQALRHRLSKWCLPQGGPAALSLKFLPLPCVHMEGPIEGLFFSVMNKPGHTLVTRQPFINHKHLSIKQLIGETWALVIGGLSSNLSCSSNY